MATNNFKIKCPRCKWVPTKNSKWSCVCNHKWNTFDTIGACPACKKKWKETQCPSCHEWSDHDDWYIIPIDFNALLNNEANTKKAKYKNPPPGGYFMPDLNLDENIKRIAIEWRADRKILFGSNPDTEHRWMEIFLNEPEQLIAVEVGMKQLAEGKGFTEEEPLEHIDVMGFSCLMALLSLRKGYRVTEYAYIVEGFVIDKHEIKNRNGSSVTLYNKVITGTDSVQVSPLPYSFENDPKSRFVSRELICELRNIKIRLDCEILSNPTPFEQYINDNFKKDLEKLRIKNSEVLYYGGKGWANMEKDLSKVLAENQKYFCLCLFTLEIFQSVLVDQYVDGYISIQKSKCYPRFGSLLNGNIEPDEARFLLERPATAGIDFNMITDFELQEFVDDAYELIDYSFNRKTLGKKMITAILQHPDFTATCKIFDRLKTAIQVKWKHLKKKQG